MELLLDSHEAWSHSCQPRNSSAVQWHSRPSLSLHHQRHWQLVFITLSTIIESKTEFAWFGKLSLCRQHRERGNEHHPAVTVVYDLSVLLDSEFSMRKHIIDVTSTCFYGWLHQIRRLVGQDLTSQLVHAFVLSWLDYGNSCLANVPKSTTALLQRVQRMCSESWSARSHHFHPQTLWLASSSTPCIVQVVQYGDRQSPVYLFNLFQGTVGVDHDCTLEIPPNTGCLDVTAHSSSMRSLSLGHSPGNFRPYSMTLPTRSSFEDL